jgi:single-strand DNA-binding protein
MSDLKMPEINEVQLAGRLTRDVEFSNHGGGLCKFGLAVSKHYKTRDGERKEETLFIDVTTWRNTAEWCRDNLSKGRPVLIAGALKQDSWDDKATGAKRSKIEVTAQRVQTLDWDKESNVQTTSPSQTVNPDSQDDDVPF